jgi:uncharacterized protein YkwD
MPRRLLSLPAVIGAAAALFAATPANPVDASSAPFHLGSVQQILINKDRAATHRQRLNWSSCLAGYARRQAQAMAGAGRIYHSNIARMFGCHLGSRYVGENVGSINGGGATLGQGYLDSTINGAFMASPHHRANIMGPYHYVATAWFTSGGVSYIAVEFA